MRLPASGGCRGERRGYRNRSLPDERKRKIRTQLFLSRRNGNLHEPDSPPGSRFLAAAVKLTTMAAVAGCEAIEAATGEKAQIKWVNDLYLNGRKVGGILTEASLGLENDFLDYVVLGIGINVYPPGNGFPEELRQIGRRCASQSAERREKSSGR